LDALNHGIVFFDFTGGKPVALKTVDIPTIKYESNKAVPVSYSMDGEWRGLFVYPGREGVFHMGVANIKTGALLRNIEMPSVDPRSMGRLTLTQIEGRKFAYLGDGDKLFWIDLQTEKATILPGAGIESNVSEFDYKGNKYLTWGTAAGSVTIYDVNNHSVVVNTPVTKGKIVSLFPFYYKGSPMAYALRDGEPPELINLLGQTP